MNSVCSKKWLLRERRYRHCWSDLPNVNQNSWTTLAHHSVLPLNCFDFGKVKNSFQSIWARNRMIWPVNIRQLWFLRSTSIKQNRRTGWPNITKIFAGEYWSCSEKVFRLLQRDCRYHCWTTKRFDWMLRVRYFFVVWRHCHKTNYFPQA